MLKPREDIGLETIDHLDFKPACQSGHHVLGKWGHVPAESAEYFVAMPCGETRLLCAGWVAELPAHEEMVCYGGCGDVHPTSAVTVTPIGHS